MAVMTTSWDDGHPLDLRVAAMLAQHGLTGTFYVPRRWTRPVMSDAQIRSLADGGFGVGAHTIDHVVLTETADDDAARQIADSRQWISDVTGQDCRMFCPPCGKFGPQHQLMMLEAGFRQYRTVEMWSTDRPRLCMVDGGRLLEMPTSVQAQPHRIRPVVRNLAKRYAARNAWNYVCRGLTGHWVDHARRMLERAITCDGVFQLWGHSWELEDESQWDRLDAVFKLMAQYRNRATPLTNEAICAQVRRGKTQPLHQ